jgi:replication initiation protein RepC
VFGKPGGEFGENKQKIEPVERAVLDVDAETRPTRVTAKPAKQGSEADVPIERVMVACWAVKKWLPAPIMDWNDLFRATHTLCAVLGISQSVKNEGINKLGKWPFSLAVAITLQKHERGDVSKPGGYIRGMIAKAEKGELRLDRSIFGLLEHQKPSTPSTAS